MVWARARKKLERLAKIVPMIEELVHSLSTVQAEATTQEMDGFVPKKTREKCTKEIGAAETLISEIRDLVASKVCDADTVKKVFISARASCGSLEDVNSKLEDFLEEAKEPKED